MFKITRVIELKEDPKKFDVVTVDKDGRIFGWSCSYMKLKYEDFFISTTKEYWVTHADITDCYEIGACEYEGDFQEGVLENKG